MKGNRVYSYGLPKFAFELSKRFQYTVVIVGDFLSCFSCSVAGGRLGSGKW